MSIRPRRLAPDRFQSAKKKFNLLLKLGTARLSNSSWVSPLHMALKGDDDERPCGDYRGINARPRLDRYPIPHIRDFAQKLRDKVFSKVDLIRAYNQIPVDEEDIPKTVITTLFGFFEFPFMSFGFRNAA